MKLTFEPFKEENFAEYKSWFRDADLMRHLGPAPDRVWLNHVLSEINGREYSVFYDDALIAVVGVIFPADGHPHFHLTDVAVKPEFRGRGIGTEVVRQLIKMHTLIPGQFWSGCVAVNNPGAKNFLERMGWVVKSDEPDEHGMIDLVLKM